MFIRTLLIVLISLIMIAVMSRYTVQQNNEAVETTIATTVATTTAYVPTGIEHENYETLQKKYKDVVGYIKIPHTVIDDVVVQAKDNKYYLRRNPSGRYDFGGSYFADYRCDMVNLSRNTVIYGHNLRNPKKLFGQLTKYKKLDFYKKSPIIYFDTLHGNYEWKIFSVFITNSKTDDGVIFKFMERDFEREEDFLHFVERSRRRSLIDCPVDVKQGDKLITLQTCDYEIDNDWRLIVMGRLLRPGESPEVDVEKAKYNENPLYPEGWYRRKGGTRPYYEDEPVLRG